MKKVKQFLGEILIIVGTAIASYNVFNFSNHDGELLCLELFGSCEGYYYPDYVLILIAAGFTLATLGILIIKNKK